MAVNYKSLLSRRVLEPKIYAMSLALGVGIPFLRFSGISVCVKPIVARLSERSND